MTALTSRHNEMGTIAQAAETMSKPVRALDLAKLIRAVPGPAVVVNTPDCRLVDANDAGRDLCSHETAADWWPEIAAWLRAPDEVRLQEHQTTVTTEQRDIVVSWMHVPLRQDTVLLLGRDVTIETNLRNALVDSRRRFRDLVDLAADFAWETDESGAFCYVSADGALGYAPDEMVGQQPKSLFLLDEPFTPLFHARQNLSRSEFWVRRKDGSAACLHGWVKPLRATDGRWVGARGLCRDITAIRASDAELAKARNRERLLHHIVRAMRDEVDPRATIEVATRATAHALGADGCRIYRRTEATSLELVADYLQAHDADDDPHVGDGLPILAPAGIMELAASAGETTSVVARDGLSILTVRTQYRHAPNGAIIVWQTEGRQGWSEDDISLLGSVAEQVGIGLSHISVFDRLRTDADNDGLTGLFNRRWMKEAVGDRLPSGGALLFIDLNNFKAVNDTHGHHAGDQLLISVAQAITRSVGDAGLAGRLGGDEFIVWLDRADRPTAEAVARRLCDIAVDLTHYSAGLDRPFGLSVGLAHVEAGSTAEISELMGRADRAMYRAKIASKTTGAAAVWRTDDEADA